MKVTRFDRARPVTGSTRLGGGGGTIDGTNPDTGTFPPSGQTPVSTGSNTWAWGSNIQTAWSNGSNQILGPHINFASGSNVHFAVASNTLTIHALGAGGGAAISGIAVKDEGVSLGAEATTLDFVGAGVSASGSGSTKTITISGGGGSSSTREDGWTKPDSAGTYDEEFEGTADTLPTNWSWISTPSTWKLNSQWKSWLIVDHPSSTAETKELRRASFTPGAVDFGLWWFMDLGLGRWNNNASWMDLFVLDSSEAEGVGIRIMKTSVLTFDARQVTGGVESSTTIAENASNNDTRFGAFLGMTRKTSDNTWRFYWSDNGISWIKVGAVGHTRSVTADRIRIRFNSGSNDGIERHSVDFVRYRPDLLLWAPR